jgi:ferredoxin--NADP+ reductase
LKDSIISVIEVDYITPSTYILRLEKKNLKFQAGQYISLGLPGDAEKREYSVYSGENEMVLEVLIKEVEEGLVSKQLKSLREGYPLLPLRKQQYDT